MAQIRWYLTGAGDTNGWLGLSETPQTAATISAGWTVGTGATLNSELQIGTERASTTFVGSTVPDGTLDTSLKDAFASTLLTGSFASGNWVFQFGMVSVTQSGAADGQVVFRLIKANADGSSATEITSAQQSSSVITNLTTTELTGTLTFNPGAITMSNQKLFVQIAWKRTGAGGMTTTNVFFRTGSSATVGTTILSADFTPTATTLTRVQGSGKFRLANGPSLSWSMGSLPAVGNAIVVEVLGASGGAGAINFASSWLTDNQGNTYSLVKAQQVSGKTSYGAAIYCCSRVGTSAGTFTLTLTGDLTTHYFVVSAVEVGGLGGGSRVLLTMVTSANTSGTNQTTADASLPASVTGEAFVASVLTRGAGAVATSIVVEVLTPTWTQEAEELDGVTYIAGEHDTRLAAGGGVLVTQWTHAATSSWAAVEAIFQSGAPPANQAITNVTIPSAANLRGNPFTIIGSLLASAMANTGANFCQSLSRLGGSLTQVTMWLQATSSPSGFVYIEIHQDSPSGTLLATSNQVNPTSPTQTAVVFTFTPFTMDQTKQYWIKIFRTDNATGTYDVVVVSGDVYSDGAFTTNIGTTYSTGLYDARLELVFSPNWTVATVSGDTFGFGRSLSPGNRFRLRR